MIKLKSIIFEIYTDKYDKYKKGWIKDNSSIEFKIEYPFSYNLYRILDVDDEERGFLVELYYKGQLIGQFHNIIDFESNEVYNDVEIDSNYRNLGLGKIILLLAINAVKNLSIDNRGITSDQNRVYKSLIDKGILDVFLNIVSIKNFKDAQKEIDNIIKNIMDKK